MLLVPSGSCFFDSLCSLSTLGAFVLLLSANENNSSSSSGIFYIGIYNHIVANSARKSI